MSIVHEENLKDRSVSLNELRSYLQVNGWQVTPNRNPRLLVYQGQQDDEGNPIQVVLTQDEGYVDAPRRIAEVITTLAELEERSVEQVVQDVASVNDDVVLWRLHDPNGRQSISVETAASFIGGLGHLLTYSACLEETPRPYFPRATAIGREFMQHCRFGHTRPGSFIFEMEAPLSFKSERRSINNDAISSESEQFLIMKERTSFTSYPPPPQLESFLIDSRQAPFSRRVMERLVRGLTDVRQATEAGDSSPLLQSYTTGLNANAYETLSLMLEGTGDDGFEFDYRWSPLLNTSPAQKRPGFVRLDMRAVEYLKDASVKLRQMKPLSEIRLRGRVSRLGADADGTPRVITLDTEVEGRPRHVRVALELSHYNLACNAHRDNRPILVTGTLEKQGRTWRLVNPKDFMLA